jgi:hypothetical protein
MKKRVLSISAIALGAALPAFGQTCPNVTCDQGTSVGNQITISGATLFRDFFKTAAHLNDFVDVDGDGCFGYTDSPGAGCIDQIDRLGRGSGLSGTYSNGPHVSQNNLWIVQNRSVGSVNGLNEFITYQICCDLPEAGVTDESTINAETYANASGPINFPFRCTLDIDSDGINNNSGTPVCPCRIDIAVLDVPSLWAVQGSAGSPSPTRRPGQPGYGVYPGTSVPLGAGCSDGTAFPSNLAQLTRPCNPRQFNFNTLSPDQDTLFDTPIVFAPIGAISNRGVGRAQVRVSELQFLEVTGRMSSGENLAAATRDAGSGTRNGWANSLGIDPAWANGDNRGDETPSGGSALANLGNCHRVTNCGGSSVIENAVQQRRLAIGYSGLSGGTAAVADSRNGLYELLDVMNDHVGGASYVRPTITSIIDNCDANTGWRIGGPETFVTVGDPDVTGNGSAVPNPTYNPGSPAFMDNVQAGNYIYNITASIAAFEAAPTADQNLFMPGQYLANTFFLPAGQDCNQSRTNPTTFGPSALNQSLQDYIRTHNNFGTGAIPDGIVTPAYGSVNRAGLVPNRGSSYSYNIGSIAAPNIQTIGAAQRLAIRNRVQGDFLYDFQRNANDIPKMMAAMFTALSTGNAANYAEVGAPLPPPGGEANDAGQQAADVIIPDVIGDMDGNGVFDPADVRYFADGLALVSGTLNRQAGFTSVDTNWTTGTTGRPAGNFFNTSITDPCGNSRSYSAGASRFDVAGSASGPAKGDSPIGADGIVNMADVCYVWDNLGTWSNLSQAATIDLSCDMNGDLAVDQSDVEAVFELGFGRCLGDLNCDGVVDIADLALLLGNFGASPSAYTQGDLNCDGVVDIADLSLILSKFGSTFPNCL